MTETKLVYVAGPYTEGLWEQNIRDVIDAANEIYETGHVPFIPHTMTTLWALVYFRPKEDWMEIDLEVLSRCDAMVRLSGSSSGADREEEFASENDIPVWDLEDFLIEYGGS